MLSFTFSIKKIFTCLYYTVKNQNSSCRITEKQLYRTFGFSCFTAYSFVVENIGFGNISYFNRRFKQKYRIAPVIFRAAGK